MAQVTGEDVDWMLPRSTAMANTYQGLYVA